MTVIDMDSFSYYTGARGVGSGAVLAGHGRDGLGALNFASAPHPAHTYDLVANGSSTRTVVGGWLKAGASGVWTAASIDVIEFTQAAHFPLSVATGPSGGLEVWRFPDGVDGTATKIGSASSVLADPDTYYHVEVRVDWSRTVGAVQIRVMGATVLNLAGVDVGSASGPIAIPLWPQQTQGTNSPCDISWDDVYVLDGNGTWANDFLGVRDLYSLIPASDGTYHQWSLPVGTHYDQVNSLPWDNATYVTDNHSFVGTTDTYNMSDIAGAGSGDIVPAVRFNVVAKDLSVSDTFDVAMHLVSGTEVDTSPSHTINPLPLSQVSGWLSTTNALIGGAWTVSAINALEIGPKITARSSSNSFASIQGIYLEVISPTPVPRSFAFGAVIGGS